MYGKTKNTHIDLENSNKFIFVQNGEDNAVLPHSLVPEYIPFLGNIFKEPSFSHLQNLVEVHTSSNISSDKNF